MKSKPPISLPKVGDWVKLRGRDAHGELLIVRETDGWATVRWLRGCRGPKLCHINELEFVHDHVPSQHRVVRRVRQAGGDDDPSLLRGLEPIQPGEQPAPESGMDSDRPAILPVK